MQRTGGDIIVEYLKAEGVKVVFGLIGSAVLDLCDALHRDGSIRFLTVQHEQAAAFMADGYARITGGPAVCLATVGPGATNVVGGLAQAWAESAPVIALLGDISTKHKGKGRSVFHEIDQEGVFRPITKLSVRVEQGERLVETLQRAFRVAVTGRQGPVAVHIPRDIQRATWDVPPVPPVSLYRPAGIVRGDAAQIARAAKLLLKAERPVLLAGGGFRWSQADAPALALAEWLDTPIVTGHKGQLPEDHPLVAGIVGTSNQPPAMQTIQEADVVLAVGCTFSQVMTASFGSQVIPERAKIIHVDIDPTEIGKNYATEIGIVGDAGSVLTDLLAALPEAGKRPGSHGAIETLAQRKAAYATALAPGANSDAVPIHRLRLMRDLRSVLDRDALISVEAGGTHNWYVYGFPAYTPMLEPGDYSIMGSAFCQALAAKVAFPGRQVCSVIGDGALMITVQELATAVAHNLNVLVVVNHNSVYGNMYQKQNKNLGGRHPGTELYMPDMAAVGRAFGCYGEQVSRPEELVPAFRRALASGKPAVIDVLLGKGPEDLEPPTKLKVADRY